jgi:enamine deaminase RidA (YjgF/YER057c/UK114 family)
MAAVPEMTSEEVWKCVFYINMYQVNWTPEQGIMVQKYLRKYLGDHYIAGTGVGVARLAYPDCLVEISVMAAVPADFKKSE